MKKWILRLGLILILVGGFLGWGFLNNKIEILNPLSNKKTVVNHKKNMKVVGFLPTWNIGKTIEYTDEISHLIFLGIEIDEKGNLIWDTQSKKINNENYLKQKELIWKNGGKNILGIKLFEDENIDKLMASEEAQDNLLNQLAELLKTNKFDGVNVDFEYMGNPTAILSEEIVGFLNKLKEENLGEISLDVFANTIIKGDQENLLKLMAEVDYLIVMAYDFHRPGVDFAGPVAPIRASVGERSILEVIEKIGISGLDKTKMVLAYPLYGYEWKTYNNEFGAAVKRGWSALASYKRMKEMIDTADTKAMAVKWDEESMTPWMSFEENGVIHQIYFENLESITRKIELAKNNQMGGIGFWALGYEGENSEVWEF
ncbi:MAG: glycosyl hydrolase family 18 protein [Candidatus Shapirobacteria bacterium]|nr:glycosyl hydrolase family 18 protein [Candidatus Shapirobacteria bacterium]MDD4410209.1 glycosyl hydrolase family 18 protein [Candidatus Shapirobacteria bacterium]